MSRQISRRRFLLEGGSAVLGLSGFSLSACAGDEAKRSLGRGDIPRAQLPAALCIYSSEGAKAAGEALMRGASALDAVEQGMRTIESIPPPRGYNVGLSAVLNAKGEAQLDAMIMDGPTHRSGAVGALQGIEHPVSVARQLMEQTPHALIVGEGAQEFAKQIGFEVKDIVSEYRKTQHRDWIKARALRKQLGEWIAKDSQAAVRAFRQFISQDQKDLTGDQRGYILLRSLVNSFGEDYAEPLRQGLNRAELERVMQTPPRRRRGRSWFSLQVEVMSDYARLAGITLTPENQPGTSVPEGHETSGVMALTASGDLAVAVSTGGLWGKLPGRIGDSPVVGAGGYVDNAVGAACAVGVGEQMIRTVGCHMVVENMRLGMAPEIACQDTLNRMLDKGHNKPVTVAVLRKDGAYAAAHLGPEHDSDRYVVFSAGKVLALESVGIRLLPSETTVEVALLQDGPFSVTISDIFWNPVRTLSDRRPAGYHTITWDGRDEKGLQMEPGVYFARVQVGDHIAPKQRLWLRSEDKSRLPL